MRKWQGLLVEAARAFENDEYARACWSCRYWAGSVTVPGQNATIGQCRRHAPVPDPAHTNTWQQWPGTDSHDWCGEYEPRAVEFPAPEAPSDK